MGFDMEKRTLHIKIEYSAEKSPFMFNMIYLDTLREYIKIIESGEGGNHDVETYTSLNGSILMATASKSHVCEIPHEPYSFD